MSGLMKIKHPFKHYPASLLLVLLFLCLFCLELTAQNLVPNPSFEEYESCPFTGDVASGPLSCLPWISYNSCNYFNECYPGPFGTPVNFRGYQVPRTGVAYTGGYQADDNGGATEYLQVELLQSMEEGICYRVGYYANLANVACGIDRLGAAITHDLEGWPGFFSPQIDVQYEYLSDTVGWFLIEGTMIAFGGEQYLTIGNFYHDDETNFLPACDTPNVFAYYYFDDVTVERMPTTPLTVSLGETAEGCDSVVLNPHVSGATYFWSDGSTGETLTVYESGTYSVAVNLGNCVGGVATVEVTILNASPVDLGADIILCEGDTYPIHLNPNAGTYHWSDGSTGPQFTITSPGAYWVFLDDGCNGSYDEIVVTGQSVPEFSLGNDTVLCNGNNLVYFFNQGMGTFTWQDNSGSNVYIVDEPGTYALTITNVCGTFSDDIEIAADSNPVFDLGPASMLLCEGDTIQYLFNAGMGNFLWQDGTMGPAYEITSPGIYGLTVTNACGSQSDEIGIEEMELPEVDLGFNVFLCPGESATFDVSDIEGVYLWQDGSVEPFLVASDPGIYSVTVTNACGVDSSQVLVEMEPDISPPDLGPDATVCMGTEVVLAIDQPGASILWSDLSTGNTLTITSSGTFAVRVYTLCESYTDTIRITFEDQAPDLDLPDSLWICEGQTTILETNVNHVTYLWSDGSQASSLLVDSAGLYAVTITNDCGQDVDSVVVTSAGLPPQVWLGMDSALCLGDTIILRPDFSAVNTWSWPDGSSDSSFLVTNAGEIIIKTENDCGQTADTIQIDWRSALPVFDLGPDTMVCAGAPVTLSIDIPDVEVLWPDGSTGMTYTTQSAGMVSAIVSNDCATAMDSIDIQHIPDLPELVLGPDQYVCPGEVIVITPGVQHVHYLWHDGSTDDSIVVSEPGLIILTISNECGSVADTLEVIEDNTGPNLDLGPDLYLCEWAASATLNSGISGVDYLWHDGSTLGYYTTTVSGIFSLTVTNACGADSDTIEVLFNGVPPSTNLGPDTTLCADQSITLTGSPDFGTTQTWSDGTTGFSLEVTQSGNYVLTETNECGTRSDTINVTIHGAAPVTDLGADTTLCAGEELLLVAPGIDSTINLWHDGSTASTFLVEQSGVYTLLQLNHCGADSDTLMVSFLDGPLPFDLGPDTTICPHESILLSVPDTSGYWMWQDGSTVEHYEVTSAGTYALTVHNVCGEAWDEIEVSVDGRTPQLEPISTLYLCADEEIELDVLQPFLAEYLWSTGSSSSVIHIGTPGDYAITVFTRCAEATTVFEVMPDTECIDEVHFYLPNIISPNNDLINDEFSLYTGAADAVISVSGTIYDRWGGVMFESKGDSFSWDGRMNGQDVSPGVYVYRVVVNYRLGNEVLVDVLVGDITIVH